MERGSALVPVLLLITLMGAVSYVLPDIYVMAKRRTTDTNRAMKIQSVAFNLKEIAKYLIFYERIIYLEDPLRVSATRLDAAKDLWGQEFGSWGTTPHHMINSCGGYDALANFVGDLRVENEPVFCPMYLRNAQLSGRMLQDLVFEKWSNGGATTLLKVVGAKATTSPAVMANVIKRKQPGNYLVEIDMTKALESGREQAMDFVMDEDVRKELVSVLKAKAKIGFEFYTDSFGFEMPGNERYVRVFSEVTFNESPASQRTVTEEESFVLFNPTIKDFSIFVPYPTDRLGNATNSMKASLELGGPDTKVEGRVYFNGNMDIDLDSLPTFYETVIISGKIVPEPSPADFERIKKKFVKGITINYDAGKYVMDGECAHVGADAVHINNQTEIFCDGNIEKYVTKASGACADSTVRVGANGVATDPVPFSEIAQANAQWKQLCRAEKFVKGGVNVEVGGAYAFLGGAFKNLNISAPSNIYGIVVGGYVKAAPGTRFVALPYLRTGLPGISTSAQLEDVNMASAAIVQGVSVPLMGIPIVKAAREGMN